MGNCFINWSGKRSRVVAGALADLLRKVEPTWTPWISNQIEAGTRWSDEIHRGVRDADFGVLCLTRENIQSRWVYYEAGALRSSLESDESGATRNSRGRICPLIVPPELSNSDLPAPLSDYECVPAVAEHWTPPPKLEASDAERRRIAADRAARFGERGPWKIVERLCRIRTQGKPTVEHWQRFVEHWPRFEEAVAKAAAMADEIPVHVEADPYIGPFSGILADIRSKVEQTRFRGDVFIYNIELQTLANPQLWEYLFDCDAIDSIHLVVSNHVLKRLENSLRVSNDVRRVFRRDNVKLRIYPEIIPRTAESTALGYFRHHSIPQQSFVYLLTKSEPWSVRDEAENRLTWHFERYTRTHSTFPARVVDRIETSARRNGHLTLRDLYSFCAGKGTTVDKVFEEHYVADDARSDLGLLIKSRASKPSRSYRCRHACGNPALLWFPPWAAADWPRRMNRLDRILSTWFDVYHVRYRESSFHYTFSAAEEDARVAIEAIRSERQEHGFDPGPHLALAVSVSAFTAAPVVADVEEIDYFGLLSPAIDLFDAIDAFFRHKRRVEMFSRRFYCARHGYQVQDVTEKAEPANYFGSIIGPEHLMDLRVRGSERCDATYFSTHLRRIVQRGTRLVLALAIDDEMTSTESAQRVIRTVAPNRNVEEIQYSWTHRISSDQFLFPTSDKAPELASLGLERLLASLKSFRLASDQDAEAWSPTS